MSEIKIDKGIPKHRITRKSKYPWNEMEVGDSFFVPGGRNKGTGAYMAGKRLGRKFSVRSWDGGIRIWRVE